MILRTSRIVTLEPESHRYFDQDGREYISVSKVLSERFKFERLEIAQRVTAIPGSRYFGVSVEEVLATWDNSAVEGREFHGLVQSWIERRPIDQSHRYFGAFKKFANGKWKYPLTAETCVWDEQLLIAGTIDIIETLPDRYRLWDVKTCRVMNGEKMLKYSMQLELYRGMLSNLTGLPVTIGGILWMPNLVEDPDAGPVKLNCFKCYEEIESVMLARHDQLTKRNDNENVQAQAKESALV